MADVDDELLALVGGDESSEDEGSEQGLRVSRERSGTPEDESIKESAPKSTKASPVAAKQAQRKQNDSDEEEGEASSPASPASQDSAPMDESDSDAGSPVGNHAMVDDEDNRYPVEGMFASEQEKEEIMGMREVERESIIAERVQEVERQRQNRLLRQLVSGREGDDKQKKRKANDADLDDAQRKSSRQKTKIGGSKAGETSAGIESLKRARAEKNDRQRRLAEDRERHKDRYNHRSRDSPDRDGGESDVEWGGSRGRYSKSRTPEVREIPPADLRDMERIRLSRSRFAMICFYPGFEEAISGCYVRVAIGPDPNTGVNVYRMALIKRFTTGKPYAMEKANRQSFVTDQYVVASHGKSEREWPFVACSDAEFTEAEFNRYKATLQSDGLPLPKKPALEAKIEDINRLRSRTWTDAELDAKLQRERALGQKYAPNERNRLLNSIEEAKRRGDSSKVSELEDQLASLKTPHLAWKTSLTQPKKPASSATSQQDRLALLNIENRRRNVEAVRKAQLKEKAKTRQLEARMARGEKVDEDTSKRLRTQPKFMQDVNQMEADRKAASGESTPANGTPKQGATAVSAPNKAAVPAHIAKLQQQTNATGIDKKGIPQIHRPIMDDDVIASLDLDIDVEID